MTSPADADSDLLWEDDELDDGDGRDDRDNAIAALILALGLALTTLLIQWRDQTRDPADLFDEAQPDLFAHLRDAFLAGESGWPAGSIAAETQAAEAYAGAAVNAMAPYLENLGAQLATMSDDAIAARADLYAGAAWPSYQAGRVEGASTAAKAADLSLADARARWVKDDIETSCDDCIGLDGQDWALDEVPFFPGDGNSACLSNCRCFLSMYVVRAQEAA